MEIENPSTDSPQPDRKHGGFLEIENAQFLKPLEECTQDGAEIEGAHLSKTLDESPEDQTEGACLPETLEKPLQCEIEDANLSKLQQKSSEDEIDDGLGLEGQMDSPKDEVNCGEDLSKNSPGPRSSSSSIYRCGSRSPNFMDKDSYSRFSLQGWNEPKPCPVGAGLANMGNTCFLNAIMQCFTHTVPLVQGLLSFKHEPSSHGNHGYCVLCAVREQIENSLAYSGSVISPSKLVDNLSYISSFFRRYQQEDAHEFLQCLLDKLDNNWSKYETSANDSSSSADSLVKQVFGGCLVSQLCCSKCGHNSYTYEPVIDLSLGIEDSNNLESALRSFTKVESIGDTEKFTCESCKEQVTGEKQLMLDQAPSVAALHLKRFKSDGVYVEKIDKKIEYPLELDLKPYIKGSTNTNEGLKYELYAVVVHVGFSSTSGHYFCYIRTAPDTWYRFDDSKVSRVLETTALSQDAYILFYARKGTTWFNSLFEEWKACCEKKVFNTSPKSVLDDTDIPCTSKSFGAGLHNFETVGKSNAEPSFVLRHEVQTLAEVDTQVSAAANITSSPSSNWACPNESKMDEADFDALNSVETNDNYNQLLTEQRNVKDTTATNDKNQALRISNEACFSSRVENIIDSEAKHDVDINPSTPTRSPTPDIYSDKEPADAAYRIPLNHLKVADKASSAKKSMEKAKHDLKRKEAVKYMSKSMPVGRRQLLMAAMMGGSSSDGSMNKKRKQASSLPGKQSKRKQVKISPKRVLRPVAA